MIVALLAGLLGGLLTSVSPCVLPVLPVVLTAGAGLDRRSRFPTRPVLVVVGMVLSFSLSTLLGSVVLSALGLPQDLLRNLGIAVLIVLGLSLLVPKLAELIERPFARLGARRQAKTSANGLVLGLGLGVLYVPCAGPVLATIAVVGATHHIGWRALLLTAAFGVGVGIPLLVFALAGDAVSRRVTALRTRARGLRLASGVLMLAFALAIAFNLTDPLQRHVPGYVTAGQQSIEGGSTVSAELQKIKANDKSPVGKTASGPADLGGKCTEGGTELENCGTAPQLTGIDSWLNTPEDAPLSLKGLRGKVVLIDFWTYSCINCQRALPHVEAWYSKYAKDGFEVIGVHTPEFAFEHVRSNVQSQAKALGVKYPIAIDNEYDTWNAYGNEYWPAEYLIDATGHVRHVSFGEGGYDTTESLIRQLLTQAGAKAALGTTTHVPTATINPNQTPETYLGSKYQPHTTTGLSLVHGKAATYHFPKNVDQDAIALDGQWTSQSEDLVAGASARLQLRYWANKVYLVLGGTGTVSVDLDGRHVQTVTVHGPPTLYPLATAAYESHLLTLSMSKGIQAYSFTFG
jgi:cytochrome c biogenesis protein CcdA/thiol-disulfide isomerase/thioredoxin